MSRKLCVNESVRLFSSGILSSSPQQPARAACSPLSPSSPVFRHWSGMMSSTAETIQPTPPVIVSPHTRIAAQSDTRSDVTPAELAKHFRSQFIYLSVAYKSPQCCAACTLTRSFIIPSPSSVFENTRADELAGKVLHIWIVPPHRVVLLGAPQTSGCLIPLRINDEHTTGLPLLM